MAKKKETYGKPCGLFPGDIVVCWGIAPEAIYRVEKTRPRIGERDLVEMVLLATLSSKPSFLVEKNIILDSSHVIKISPEIIVKHVRRLSNDMSILLSALEKQQDTEKERRECPLKEVKPKRKSSATK
jgi:hypothetical protein